MTFARAAYDAAGNRASVSDPNGVQTSYSHDARNRLRRIETQQGAATVLQGLTYTLNANGTRAALTEDSGRTVAFTYDALDRLTEEAVTDPSLGNRTTRWTYDAVGNRLAETTVSALGTETVSYAYDANDRLLTESGPNENAYRFTGEPFDEALGRFQLLERSWIGGWGGSSRLTRLPGPCSARGACRRTGTTRGTRSNGWTLTAMPRRHRSGSACRLAKPWRRLRYWHSWGPGPRGGRFAGRSDSPACRQCRNRRRGRPVGRWGAARGEGNGRLQE